MVNKVALYHIPKRYDDAGCVFTLTIRDIAAE